VHRAVERGQRLGADVRPAARQDVVLDDGWKIIAVSPERYSTNTEPAVSLAAAGHHGGIHLGADPALVAGETDPPVVSTIVVRCAADLSRAV
jgi:hypothetical protein